MNQIRALQTFYNGFHFRSRLEARWAVFFDALDIAYEYEPQGFAIENCGCTKSWAYLPDFYLPDLGAWVEVKGDWGSVTDDYLEMLTSAVDFGGQLPNVGNSSGETRGLLLLGGIPHENNCVGKSPFHVVLQHDRGVRCNEWQFRPSGACEVLEASRCFDTSGDYAGEIRDALHCARSYCYPHEPCAADAYRAARRSRFEHGARGN